MSRPWIVAAVAVVVLALVAVALLFARAEEIRSPGATAGVQRRTISRTLTFQGNVDFGRQAELTSPADALVALVPARVGQEVAAGAILVGFDRRDTAAQRGEVQREDQRLGHWLQHVYPAQRRSLDAEARSIDLRLRQETGALAAKARATRQARAEGIATAAEAASADRELALASAKAGAERAAQRAQRAALDHQRVESQLGRSAAASKLTTLAGDAAPDVRAPFAGKVTAVSAVAQTRAAAGSHLVSIVDPGFLVISVPVPASEIYRLSGGAPVTCYLPRQGRGVACQLIDIVRTENIYRARFRLAAAGEAERGEAGDVRLNLRGPANALTVPVAAIVRRGGAVGVRVETGKGVRFVPVRILFFGTSEVAVDGALTPGQRVLIDP
ncbi:MAG: HlyD family efflux transporter periplasmic adaptor subunit [Allosphingosinicella sp.]